MNKIKFLFALALLAATTTVSVAQTPDIAFVAFAFKEQPSSEGYAFGIWPVPQGYVFAESQKSLPDAGQGRPHTATSGDDLRPAVPTLRNVILDLHCVLATVGSSQGENGATSVYPATLLLVLTRRNDTWRFLDFARRYDRACDAEPATAVETRETGSAKSSE